MSLRMKKRGKYSSRKICYFKEEFLEWNLACALKTPITGLYL